jgi:hypothetical protein
MHTNSPSIGASAAQSLLIMLLLNISSLVLLPAATDKIRPDYDRNPLQVALLKWSPNLTTTFTVGATPIGVAFDALTSG